MPHPSPAFVTQQTRDLRRRIGLALHGARAERGLMLPKLSAQSGVPAHTIDQIELGKGEADLHTLLRLCSALRVEFTAMVT